MQFYAMISARLASYFLLIVAVLIFLRADLRAQISSGIESGVEVSWATSAHYTSSGGPWTDLGAEQSGDGNPASFYDDHEGRIYQILETSPDTPPIGSSPANGGFESGTGNEAESWSAIGAQSVTRSNAEAQSGTYSMHANLSLGAIESQLSQNVVAAGGVIPTDETFDLSFWIKQGPQGPSYVQQYEVQWFDVAGGFLGSTGLNFFSGTEGVWEEFRVSGLSAPENTAEALIRFRFVTGAVPGASGEVYIDEVQLGSPSQPGIPGVTSVLNPSVTPASRLTWLSTTAFPHQAFYSSDLANWIELGPTITGDGSVWEIIIPQTELREFYRVSIPGVMAPPSNGDFIPLFNANTILEAPTQEETETALITHIGDRARDRHARESDFQAYDHYLPWYWEERTIDIEIVDEVAKGGSNIIFYYNTLTPLGAAEFRTFFRGIGTVAEYHHNQIADLIGPNQYRAVVDQRYPTGGALQVGDRVEVEISMFLAGATNGRNNYYGTTMLYIVGQGIVPWEGRTIAPGPPLDSYPLPENAWLGGLTTLPYQYSEEPDNHFKQLAGNMTPTNVQPFVLGRRLHHTDFETGAHSEPENPIFSIHANKLGPSYVGNSCVACHVNNGRSMAPSLNADMFQSVVKVGSDTAGSSHPTLGSVLQPQSSNTSPEGRAVISSYTTINGTYGDGTSYSLRKPNYSFTGPTPSHFSVRVAPPLVGMGLLEAIKESDIVALADPLGELNLWSILKLESCA